MDRKEVEVREEGWGPSKYPRSLRKPKGQEPEPGRKLAFAGENPRLLQKREKGKKAASTWR